MQGIIASAAETYFSYEIQKARGFLKQRPIYNLLQCLKNEDREYFYRLVPISKDYYFYNKMPFSTTAS